MNNTALDIVLALMKGESHIRELARSLNIPNTTVLRELHRLVRAHVLDCKKEGKNKVFSLRKTVEAQSYVFIAERYKLLRLLQKHQELSVIIEGIFGKCGERLIILFGSYAKGTAKKESDIDIYIETNNRKVKKEIESLHSSLWVKTGKFKTDSLLIKEIVKNHVILRGAEDFYEKTGFFEKII
jgi:predicted nucleotidyltransferase